MRCSRTISSGPRSRAPGSPGATERSSTASSPPMLSWRPVNTSGEVSAGSHGCSCPIAHTAGLGVAIAAHGVDVGIDIERIEDRPDSFDPGRFADPKAVNRFAYIPFGDGPRICIGASFAIQEAVIILSTLLARFRFAPVAGREPKPVMILTLRPEGGVWLNVSRA